MFETPEDRKGVAGKRATLLAAVLLGIAAAGLILGAVVNAEVSEKDSYRIYVSPRAGGDYNEQVEAYRREHPKLHVAKTAAGADIIIDTVKRKGCESAVLRRVPALTVHAGDKRVTMGEGKNYLLLSKRRDRFVQDLERYLEVKPAGITMTACGDIVPGRHAAERMAQHGAYYPFEKAAPYVRGSDIVYAVLEAPLTDRVKAPYTGMNFAAPSYTVEGIKLCGFNILAVANNHSTNFGRAAFTDTLELLRANNIQFVGGGGDIEAARSPVFKEVKGVRFAFLDYNAVYGALDATEDQAGVAGIRLRPWYPDSEEDFEMVEGAVRSAKKKADVVVVGFHWGAEEVYYPGDSVKRMAHNAVEAGADLVIGTHPHSVQPLEYYRGSLIAYSLGNFVFDQMYTTQVREGMMMKCSFEQADLVAVELVPYKIYDFCQPVVLTGSSGQYLLDHILEISGVKAAKGKGAPD